MRKKQISTAAMAAMLSLALLAGCASPDKSGNAETASGTSATAAEALTGTVDAGFDSGDYYFDWRSGSYTTLNMSTGAQSVTRSGVYEITGTLNDGSLSVNVDKSFDKGTVYLVLNNVSIISEKSAPIYVEDAEKVVLILENNTVNTVTQGSGVVVNADNEPSAAVFSKADLTIAGGGTLNVVSDFNDGITSKDALKLTDGTLYIEAKSDGITGKDLLAVEKADITVVAGKDGLRATNDTDAGMGNLVIKNGVFDISAGNDAVQASGLLQLDGGSFDLTSGGGYAGIVKTDTGFGPGDMGGKFLRPGNQNGTIPTPRPDMDSGAAGEGSTFDPGTDMAEGADSGSDTDSKKCLKATGGIIINSGTILTSAYEDALNSNGGITITDGNLTLSAGDDAIHADGVITIEGGIVTVAAAYEAIEGKNITITDGDISVTASDDGFNVNDAAGVLTLGGGTVYVNAGGDGLDANGSVVMTGGTVYVDGPTNNGNGAIDYQTGFTISGGVLFATGGSGMAQTGDGRSSQPALLIYYTSAQAAGTAVTVKDESGNTVAAFTPSKEYSSAAISAPGLKTGQTYTICSGGLEVVAFTLTDTVTYLNESGVTTARGMGPGGQPSGGPPGGGTMPEGGRPDGGRFQDGAAFGETDGAAQ